MLTTIHQIFACVQISSVICIIICEIISFKEHQTLKKNISKSQDFNLMKCMNEGYNRLDYEVVKLQLFYFSLWRISFVIYILFSIKYYSFFYVRIIAIFSIIGAFTYMLHGEIHNFLFNDFIERKFNKLEKRDIKLIGWTYSPHTHRELIKVYPNSSPFFNKIFKILERKLLNPKQDLDVITLLKNNKGEICFTVREKLYNYGNRIDYEMWELLNLQEYACFQVKRRHFLITDIEKFLKENLIIPEYYDRYGCACIYGQDFADFIQEIEEDIKKLDASKYECFEFLIG